jgi:hypothetical protein
MMQGRLHVVNEMSGTQFWLNRMQFTGVNRMLFK